MQIIFSLPIFETNSCYPFYLIINPVISVQITIFCKSANKMFNFILLRVLEIFRFKVIGAFILNIAWSETGIGGGVAGVRLLMVISILYWRRISPGLLYMLIYGFIPSSI